MQECSSFRPQPSPGLEDGYQHGLWDGIRLPVCELLIVLQMPDSPSNLPPIQPLPILRNIAFFPFAKIAYNAILCVFCQRLRKKPQRHDASGVALS